MGNGGWGRRCTLAEGQQKLRPSPQTLTTSSFPQGYSISVTALVHAETCWSDTPEEEEKAEAAVSTWLNLLAESLHISYQLSATHFHTPSPFPTRQGFPVHL